MSAPWRRGAPAAAVVLAVALALASPGAQAGRTCEERPGEVARVALGLELAAALVQQLENSGAQVVLLARAGQDLAKYGLRWSHLAFAYREEVNAQAQWRVVHKLNQCGADTAGVFRQGVGDFFLDDPHRFEAAYMVPNAWVQAQLWPLLQNNAALAQWHSARYSMLAYPWAQTYQQSNQWLLETLAGALEPQARSRAQAQAWLQLRGYQPTTLRLGALTRLGARLTSANVAFDDHPNAKRFSDRIETVSADSVFDWLIRAGLGAPALIVRLPS